MKERKIILEKMRKNIIIKTFDLMLIILVQFIFFIWYMITQNLSAFICIFVYVVYYKIKIGMIQPYYNKYKNIKIEEEFDVKPVTGGMSSNLKNE